MSITETHKYDDIINLPHHVSYSRPRMSNYDRAAQFSPFAALTGYGDAVKETERTTDKKHELTEDEKSAINQKLHILLENIDICPSATVTYFEADKLKDGGEYIDKAGKIKDIDSYARTIIFTDKTQISIVLVKNISSPIFDRYSFE